ncbi:MAG TPA: lysylphosphatidylglycerol synthase transmembrane domain-containing protein [Vicinamibacterales bacterium]|nr:lysylphosphatidylglycerol synthase transmembrane domain-containing protein [Vicinamibacterales bacterium]
MAMTADEAPARPARRALLFILKLSVSIMLLVILLRRTDAPRLWEYVREASAGWLTAALGIYFLMIVASAWRWGLLLAAQGVKVPAARLTESFLVATFFNNFLPSNIGGDVIRIADTAPAAKSRTLAAAVVIADRAIGLIGLVLLAAMAATASRWSGREIVSSAVLWLAFAGAGIAAVAVVVAPDRTIALLSPLRAIHPGWVGPRLRQLTDVLTRFRESPGPVLSCFAGAVLVQILLVAFYAAVAEGIGVPVSAWHMAVVVPVSFLAQLLPVSLNGLGVREAVFSYYFSRLGAPIEGALVISLLGAGLVMLFSLTGALAYVLRRN